MKNPNARELEHYLVTELKSGQMRTDIQALLSKCQYHQEGLTNKMLTTVGIRVSIVF